MEKMYGDVLSRDLTFGVAMDAAIHGGQRVARAVWGGYWELQDLPTLTEPVLVAVLKDGGATLALPYPSDILATDWMVVE